jgi:N-methylhydantoinase A
MLALRNDICWNAIIPVTALPETTPNPDVDAPQLFLGVDVGGTFTDVIFYSASGTMRCIKVPTVPTQPGLSTLAGIDEILASEPPPNLVGWERVSQTHSSTIATNALIERRGPVIGLLTTAGFRDLMDFQRLHLPHPMRYDSRRPAPLVRRANVREIRERIGADGTVIEPLVEADVVAAARDLRDQGIDDVVICFLHSYRNPEHERLAAEIIVREVPGARIDVSSALWPQAREYERATLASINSLVRPAIHGYLDELEEGLRTRGIESRPHVARSNGGSESARSLRSLPASALLSGPAAGVAGAAVAAAQAGWERADLVTFDVGGTSADIGVVRRGVALLSTEEHVGDFPILLPTVAVSSIGAGGGSIIWFDAQGHLQVGPRSVGSYPGPACYGRSSEPTVAALTDALVEVGLIGPGQALGGKIAVEPELARRALEAVAADGAMLAEDVANGAIQIAVAKTVAEATRVLARRGIDAPRFRMVAFGGAGPLLAAMVAEEIEVHEILIPRTPGALSALGTAHADIEGDLIVPMYARSGTLSSQALTDAGAQLQAAVGRWLDTQREAVEVLAVHTSITCDMRYDGQGFDVAVPVDADSLRRGEVATIVGDFHRRHHDAYGHAEESAEVWCKELRAHVVGIVSKPASADEVAQDGSSTPAERTVTLDGSVTVPVLERASVGASARLDGPLIIEQLDTTTYVPGGWRLTGHPSGHLVMTRSGAR